MLVPLLFENPPAPMAPLPNPPDEREVVPVVLTPVVLVVVVLVVAP